MSNIHIFSLELLLYHGWLSYILPSFALNLLKPVNVEKLPFFFINILGFMVQFFVLRIFAAQLCDKVLPVDAELVETPCSIIYSPLLSSDQLEDSAFLPLAACLFASLVE